MTTEPLTLRQPDNSELAELSALCQRSKAYWGYDQTFMAACAQELTATAIESDLRHLSALKSLIRGGQT